MSSVEITNDVKHQYALLVDPHTGREFNLCRFATSLGRSVSNDVVLTDKSVSRQHAVIYCLKGKFYIEDIGSTNGTMVNNGALSSRIELNSGDVIRLGITRLLFMLIADRDGRAKVIIPEAQTEPMGEDAVPASRQPGVIAANS
jgi:pSer/pThr/pTyr-binding forkhead associated (FHA) protein